jgi:hypothetical protein
MSPSVRVFEFTVKYSQNIFSDVECVIVLLSHTPSWSDTHPKITPLMLEVVTHLFASLPLCRSASSSSKGDCKEKRILHNLLSPLLSLLILPKTRLTAENVLLRSVEVFGRSFVCRHVCRHVSPLTASSAKFAGPATEWIARCIDEFGKGEIPCDAFTTMLRELLSNANPALKKSAAIAIVKLYRHYGDAFLRGVTKDIKPALVTAIEKEIKKEDPPAPVRVVIGEVTQKSVTTSSRPTTSSAPSSAVKADVTSSAAKSTGLRKPTVSASLEETPSVKTAKATTEGDGDRADLSNVLTADLLQKMTDKDWMIRRDAIQSFEAILIQHQKKVLPKGLSPFIGILKKNLSEANSSVVIASLSALGTIGESIGVLMERTVPSLLPSVFSCFDVSRRSVTQAAFDCVRIWIEKAGVPFASFAPYLGDPIGRPSYIRRDFLVWIHSYLKDLPVTVSVDHLVTPTLHSVLDRDEEVKSAAKDILLLISTRIGLEPFQSAIESDAFSSSAKRTLIPILQSVTSEKQKGSPVDMDGVRDGGVPKERKGLKKPTAGKKREDEEESLSLLRNPGKKDIRSIQNKSHPWKDLIGFSEESMRSRGEESGTFSVIRQEMMKSFSMELLACASPPLHFLLSSSDPSHTKCALDFFEPLIAPSSLADPTPNKEVIFESLDVLLKWGTLRLFSLLDSSPSPSPSAYHTLGVRLLSFMLSLLHFLMRNDSYLSNYEAEIFIPFLLHLSPVFSSLSLSALQEQKTPKRKGEGESESSHTLSLHMFFEVLSKIFPASKLFGFLIDSLLDPSRISTPSLTSQKQEEVTQYFTEILTEIGSLLRRHGLTVCKPSVALPAIASFISDPREMIQKSAVASIGEAYAHGRERIWIHLTGLSEETRGVILEYLRTSRDIPTSTTPHSLRSTSAGRRTPSASSTVSSSSSTPSDTRSAEEEKSDEMSSLPSDPIPAAPLSDSSPQDPSPSPPVSISTVGSWVEVLSRKEESREKKEWILQSIAKEVHREESVFSLYVERITLSLLSLLHDECSGDVTSSADSNRFVLLILESLSALFEGKSVSSAVSSRTLNSLIESILDGLVREKAAREGESEKERGEREKRASGWETVKARVIANAKGTYLYSSLLIHLRGLVSSVTSQRGRMCVDCLAMKTDQLIRSDADVEGDLNYKHLLREIHLFLSEEASQRKAVGSGSRADSLYYDAVFSLLKAIVQRKGEETLKLLSLVPSHPTPLIVTLINSLLKGNTEEATTPSTAADTPTSSSAESSQPGSQQQTEDVTVSSNAYELTPELILILKTIGDKQTTMKGLQDLLAYKRSRDISDISPFLSRLSQSFRSYILSALSALEKKEERERREREGRERAEREERERVEREERESIPVVKSVAVKVDIKPTENVPPNPPIASSQLSSSSIDTLRKVSERCGSSVSDAQCHTAPIFSSAASSSSSSLSGGDATTNISALRQRLALMRQQAASGSSNPSSS